MLLVQEVVDDDNVKPEILKYGTYNEDPACKELVAMAHTHGIEIKDEAVRARIERDKHPSRVVPWDKKQQRPMRRQKCFLLRIPNRLLLRFFTIY